MHSNGTAALLVFLFSLSACSRNEQAKTDQNKDNPPLLETASTKDRVLPENVKQIERGMPIDRVEQILGAPSPQKAHEYLEREHGIKCIEEISFYPTWAGAKVWVGEHLDIVVSYDTKGLVISTATFPSKQKRPPRPVDVNQKTP